MKRTLLARMGKMGGVSSLAGVIICASFAALIPFPSLRGPHVAYFFAYFLIASAAYTVAVARLGRDHIPLTLLWGFAILYRLFLLASPPTLSDDVYRYIWDGHLMIRGINPYAQAVNSGLLDPYITPLRDLINHDWMASPYLPVSQFYFAIIEWIAPQQPLSFQLAAATIDLLTGWLVMDILGLLALPRRRALIYLWNPLVVVEFSGGAHLDALMIFLMMGSFWFLVRGNPMNARSGSLRVGSAISMAAATLTKAVPALVAPLFLRRWGGGRLLLYAGILIASSILFAWGAGWGIAGPLDGTGLFGALRIFARDWNYNSGIYHWMEVSITGFQTPGAVPIDVVGETPILLAKILSGALIVLCVLLTSVWAWHLDDPMKSGHQTSNLYLLRLSLLPLGAYLLFTSTIHPWYVTVIVPFLPFLLSAREEPDLTARFIWPGIYLSIIVALSYTTYFNAADLREFHFVRILEYIPYYALLLWASFPYLLLLFAHSDANDAL